MCCIPSGSIAASSSLAEVLNIAHEASIFGGSPLSRSVSLVPSAMAPGAAPSRTVGVHVLVLSFSSASSKSSTDRSS